MDMGRRDRLVEAGIALASQLSLPVLLRQIVDIAVDISEARYGALGVLGADGGLSQFITQGITEEEREAIGNVPVGHGVLGAMMRETVPLRISDISAHPNSVGFPKNHPQMTTFLGAPIVAHGNVFGDLYLADKAGSKEFTAEDEEAVSVLAAQAGVAIENAHLYEEIRRHEAWLDAGSAITMAMLGGAGSDETLRLIAQRARGLVAADLATIALPDVTGTRLVLKVVDGVHAEELYGATFPVEGSVSGRVIRESQAAVFENVTADGSSSQPDVRGDIGPAIVVPLVGKDGAFGTLLAANLQGGRTFGPADVLPLEAFADQAALAFEYSRLQEEGRRIARDLHDGVAQELAFVARRARRLALTTDNRAVDQIASAAERGLAEARRQLAALTQPFDEPLDAALARAVEEIAERNGAQVELDVAPGVKVGNDAREGLIRIACEAVSNAIRHARAHTIRVGLSAGDTVRLTVADDGAGFDPESVVTGPGSGFGLISMRERAESLGAKYRIASQPGAGTEVEVVLG